MPPSNNSLQKRFGVRIETAEVDADEVEQTIRLIEKVKPDLLVNLALPIGILF